MIDEKYLRMAITIRRTYLKMNNNLDLYGSKAIRVKDRLEEAAQKVEDIEKELTDNVQNKNISEKEVLEKLLKIVDEIEEEGKILESAIEPINKEIENLAKQEQELYRQIVEHYPQLSEDQIVSIVRDRLIKEGLS